jgi:hypothetical protein
LIRTIAGNHFPFLEYFGVMGGNSGRDRDLLWGREKRQHFAKCLSSESLEVSKHPEETEWH